MEKAIDLLLIDPQNDFCSEGGVFYEGCYDAHKKRLDKDVESMVIFLKNNFPKIKSITVSLDTHHSFDISHPSYWVNCQRESPEPFDVITVEDIKNGKWKPWREEYSDDVETYLMGLRNQGKYDHRIWPPHCLAGSWGHAINEKILYGLSQWEDFFGEEINYIYKGLNPHTEHFSAFEAEIPSKFDSSTEFFIPQNLEYSENIVVMGEALSHCVASSVRSLVKVVSPEVITLVTDATSNVQGCDSLGDAFIRELTSKGMKTMMVSEFGICYLP